MTDPHEARRNFERNKTGFAERTSLLEERRNQRRKRLSWSAGAVLASLGMLLAFPETFASFIRHSTELRASFVSNWLVPDRWDGLYQTRPEGYVDGASMRLSTERNIFLSLTFEPDHLDFDGELISEDFCQMDRPYSNVLVRGYQNAIFRNRMRLEIYDIRYGERIELGEMHARIDPPVIELSGWILGEKVRIARDYHTLREDLPTLC